MSYMGISGDLIIRVPILYFFNKLEKASDLVSAFIGTVPVTVAGDSFTSKRQRNLPP
jgi:hypothetical protein